MKIIQKVKKLPKLLLVGLAFVLLLNLYLAWRDSQTIDEAAHLGAGYSYLTTRDFRMNPEHPVPFKLLAGMMILPLDTKPAENLKGWDESNQWTAGQDLLYNSQASARKILFLARLPSIVITLALEVATFFLGRRLFNEKVGLLASVLISLDPTLNGHGHLITNDIFLALGVVLFILAALRYLANPSRKQLLLLAASLLVVVNTKFTGLIFIPISLALVVWKKRRFKSIVKGFAVLTGIVIIGTWAFYGFQLRSINEENAVSPPWDEFTEQTANLKNRFPAIGKLYDVKIPAYSYMRGMATLYSHNKDGHTTYFFGDRDRHGNLLYFPVAIAVKMPPIVLGAVITAILVLIFRRQRIDKVASRHIVLCLLISGIFLAIAMSSGINIGIRHVFGAWPFLYILAAYIFSKLLVRTNRQGNILLLLTVLVYIPVLVACLRWPIAYQNEFGNLVEQVADRPILVDSNSDWAQDLWRLREYLDKNKIDSFGEAIFSNYIEDDIFGDKQVCTLDLWENKCTDPEMATPCLVAISETARWLTSENRYRWAIDSRTLVAKAGRSISIYNCQ